MKKLCILLLAAMLLTACGKPTVIVSGDAAAASASSSSGSSTQSSQEIVPLSGFNGKGLYRLDANDNNDWRQYLTYIDAETATQVPLCNAPSCQHSTADCTAVFALSCCVYSYGEKLIYFSDGTSIGYDSSVKYGAQIEAPSIIIADATGGNRKTLGTVNGAFIIGFPNTVIGDDIIFGIQADETNFINKINIKTGEAKQILQQPMSSCCEYLSFYNNNIVFTTTELKDKIMTTQVCLLNVDDGSVKNLAEIKSAHDLESDNNEQNYLSYYDGKVYRYSTRTSSGLDILQSIDCETGEVAVIRDDIVDESFVGQYIHNIVNDVMIIDSPQNGDDKALPGIVRFSINLNTGEQSEIGLTSKDPADDKLYSVKIISHMGDNLLVEHNHKKTKMQATDLDGNPIETEYVVGQLAIISKEDYLSGTPNFKTITK